MKKQLTVFMLATFILPAFAAAALAGDYHAARRERREASEERYEAREDAAVGDRAGANMHRYEAKKEARKAWRHEHHL
jgi:hypothetical protein